MSAAIVAALLAAGARHLRSPTARWRRCAGCRRAPAASSAAATRPSACRCPTARDEVGELAETLNAMLGVARARPRGRAALRRRRLARAAHAADRAARQRRLRRAPRRRTRTSLADIEADAARLSGLLDDLLALAREDAAAPRARRAGRPRAIARRGGRRPSTRATAGGDRGDRARRAAGARARRRQPRAQRAQARPARTGRSRSPPSATATARGSPSPTRAPGWRPARPRDAFERFWRGRGARGEGSGPRARDRARDRRAPRRQRRRSTARASRSSSRLSRISQRAPVETRPMRRTPHANDAPHRVVIVGGGFGGLYAAKALRRAPVEVTLVDRADHHLFQPLLSQVATGASPRARSRCRCAPARPPAQRARRARRGRRRSTSTHARIEPLELEYDSLIVAAGATDDHRP